MRIWSEHRDALYKRVTRITGEAQADDLVSDVLVRALTHAHHLDASFAHRYLMKSATNAALDYRRYQKRWLFIPLTNLNTPARQDESVSDALLGEKTRPAINDLPPHEREALLRYLTDEDRAAASRRTGIPASTLRSREERAINKIRKKLG